MLSARRLQCPGSVNLTGRYGSRSTRTSSLTRSRWVRKTQAQIAAIEARGISVVWADANAKDYGQMSRAAYAAIALHQRAPLWRLDDGSAP
jgi:hypothetical protein